MGRASILEMLYEIDHKVDIELREKAYINELYKKADEERKRLIETVKCQQETIKVLQAEIGRLTAAKETYKVPFTTVSEFFKPREDENHE